MEYNAENIDLIDRYLEGDMNNEELAAFEHQLAIDDAFREQVEAQRLAIDQIRYQAALKKMKKIGADLNKSKSTLKKEPRISRMNFIIGIAASTLLLIGFFVIYKTIENKNIAQKPSTEFDTDKYGSDSPLDFNETLTVKQFEITNGAIQEIPSDKKINLSIIVDQSLENYYDYRAVNNDLFILVDKTTLSSVPLNPSFIFITNEESRRLYLKLSNQYYLIEEGKKQPLIKEEEETVLNILEKQ